jgi:hypothetical protein
MNRLFSMLADHLGDQVEYNLKRAISPIAPYLRRLAMGAACLFLGALTFSLTLILLGVALFSGFGGYGHVVSASLWTALPFGVLCLAFFSVGLHLLRRPR